MSKNAKKGDVYCIKSPRFNKWCAYQVIEEQSDKVALLTLDWFADDLPTESDLLTINPLLLERFGYNKDLHTWYTSYKAIPRRFTYVGNTKILSNLLVSAYSDWPNYYCDAEQEYIWQQYPQEERQKYTDANRSRSNVIVNGKELSAREYRVYLTETVFAKPLNLPFEFEKFSEWSQLEQLGALTQVFYDGSNEEVLSYVENSQFISTLKWRKHGKKEIDISRTNLEHFIVDTQLLDKLVLNEHLIELCFGSVNGDELAKLQIDHPAQGLHLKISMHLDSGRIPDFNLPNLSQLSIVAKNVDGAQIAMCYPNLETLLIWGEPGNIHNIACLGRLKKLRLLQLKDLFGFTSEQFPPRRELKGIEELWLTSVPAEAAKNIKKTYKDCLKLRISQPRSESWLEANLNNPFRDWDGRDGIPKKHTKAAVNAYKKALSGLSKMSSESVNIEVTQLTLKEFVSVFNKMNFIETVEREEIYDVFVALLRKIGLDVAVGPYTTWFDEWRDF